MTARNTDPYYQQLYGQVGGQVEDTGFFGEGFLDTAGDVGLGVVNGAEEAIRSFVGLAEYTFGAEDDKVDWNLVDAPDTTVGQIAGGFSQYLAGSALTYMAVTAIFGAVSVATGGAAALAGGAIATMLMRGGSLALKGKRMYEKGMKAKGLKRIGFEFFAQAPLVDGAAFAADEGRLVSIINQYEPLQNELFNYIEGDGDDSIMEGRLKNVLDGMVAGAVAEPVFQSMKAIYRAARRTVGNLTPEQRAKIEEEAEEELIDASLKEPLDESGMSPEALDNLDLHRMDPEAGERAKAIFEDYVEGAIDRDDFLSLLRLEGTARETIDYVTGTATSAQRADGRAMDIDSTKLSERAKQQDEIFDGEGITYGDVGTFNQPNGWGLRYGQIYNYVTYQNLSDQAKKVLDRRRLKEAGKHNEKNWTFEDDIVGALGVTNEEASAIAGLIDAIGFDRDTFLFRRGEAVDPDSLKQTVFHGTGGKHTSLSVNYVGGRAGEGAQAFGWGVYFGGAEWVARHYRRQNSARMPSAAFAIGGDNLTYPGFWRENNPDIQGPPQKVVDEEFVIDEETAQGLLQSHRNQNERLAREGKELSPLDELTAAADILSELSFRNDRQLSPEDLGDYMEAELEGLVKSFRSSMSRFESRGDTSSIAYKNTKQKYETGKKLLNNVNEKVKSPTQDINVEWRAYVGQPGRTFEVDMKIKEDQMLLWDRPFSKQHPNVQRILQEVFGTDPGAEMFSEFIDGDGGRFYRQLMINVSGKKNLRKAKDLFDAQKTASLRLADYGIYGIKYQNGGIRNKRNYDTLKDADFNYVLFRDQDFEITRMYQRNAEIQGQVSFLEDGRALIEGFESANFSTGVHEVAHVARRRLFNRDIDIQQRQGISEDDIAVAEKWAGAKNGVWDEAAEERFAVGFEKYLRDGKAPIPAMENMFKKMAAYMRAIYDRVRGSSINVRINPEMRKVFDKLVTRTQADEMDDLRGLLDDLDPDDALRQDVNAATNVDEVVVSASNTLKQDQDALARNVTETREHLGRLKNRPKELLTLASWARKSRRFSEKLGKDIHDLARAIQDGKAPEDAGSRRALGVALGTMFEALEGYRQVSSNFGRGLKSFQKRTGVQRITESLDTYAERKIGIDVEGRPIHEVYNELIVRAGTDKSAERHLKAFERKVIRAYESSTNIGEFAEKVDGLVDKWTLKSSLSQLADLNAVNIISGVKTITTALASPFLVEPYRMARNILGEVNVQSAADGDANMQKIVDAVKRENRVMFKSMRYAMQNTKKVFNAAGRDELQTMMRQTGLAVRYRLDNPSMIQRAGQRLGDLTGDVVGGAIVRAAGATSVATLPGKHVMPMIDRVSQLAVYQAKLESDLYERHIAAGLDHAEAAEKAYQTAVVVMKEPEKMEQQFLGDEIFKRASRAEDIDEVGINQAVLREIESTRTNHELLRADVDKARVRAQGVAFNRPVQELAESETEVASRFTQGATRLAASATRMVRKHPSLRFFAPFLTVPVNVAAVGLENTVGGSLEAMVRAGQATGFGQLPGVEALLQQMRHSNPERAQAAATNMYMASMVVGSFGALLSRDGMVVPTESQVLPTITGGGPKDLQMKRAMINAGWQPYSVRVGDQYFSYQRVEPIASWLGLLADSVQIAHYYRNSNEYETAEAGMSAATAALSGSLVRQLTDKNFTRGLSDLFQILSGDMDHTNRWLSDRVRSLLIPNSVRDAAKYADHINGDEDLRATRTWADKMLVSIPGWTDEVKDSRRDLLGYKVKRELVGDSILFDFAPTNVRTINDQKISSEIARLSNAWQLAPRKYKQVDMMDESLMRNGRTLYDRWQQRSTEIKLRGMDLRQSLRRIIGSQKYQSISPYLDDDGNVSPRVRMIEAEIRRFRDKAFREMLKEEPELASQYKQARRISRARRAAARPSLYQ